MITKEITVWCDYEPGGEHKCFTFVEFNEADARGLPSRARMQARRIGWTYQAGKDLCRAHSGSKSHIARSTVPSITLDELRAQHESKP